MKKNFLSIFFALLVLNFFSCGTTKFSPKNKFDWTGTYTGVIPAADAPGINVEVTLNNDGIYKISYQYIERGDDLFINTGTFTWNNDGSTIILDSKELPPYYKVGKNTLTQLDMSGKKIVGTFAGNYVLKKAE
ncbi:MAG: copper resistance protein NlpE [Spirochaetaceae bacterium]|jgi:uncharacterized lipoprotein NlpE involved in copper resistance|nr:copper resistance protein NlpE [Spirochaetaceae bacterium]